MKRLFPKAALFGLLAATLMTPLQLAAQRDTLSLEDAAAILNANSNVIKSAATATEVAKAQKRQLNSTWYPNVSVAGGYFHFSNEISVEADLGGAVQDLAQGLVQAIPQLEMLLPQLQQQFALAPVLLR